MAYSADTFVADEQPTTAKWNKLWSNDAAFNDGTGIGAGAITPEKLVSGNGTGWAYQSWTPTFSGFTVGNAVVTGRYCVIGKAVLGRLTVVLGTTSAMTGDFRFSLPVTSAAIAGTAVVPYIGASRCFDVSPAGLYPGHVIHTSTTEAGIRSETASGTYTTQAVGSSTIPFTWATSDEIHCAFSYEAA